MSLFPSCSFLRQSRNLGSSRRRLSRHATLFHMGFLLCNQGNCLRMDTMRIQVIVAGSGFRGKRDGCGGAVGGSCKSGANFEFRGQKLGTRTDCVCRLKSMAIGVRCWRLAVKPQLAAIEAECTTTGESSRGLCDYKYNKSSVTILLGFSSTRWQ